MHHVEVAPWYPYDYRWGCKQQAAKEIGTVPKAGGLDVDYDALTPEVVFAIETAPQLLVDGRSFEARTGQPETRRVDAVGNATHAMPSVGRYQQPVLMVDPSPPPPKVY